jgi:D-alanine-D-alanine ligase
MARLRVGVIFGGRSVEHEVSIVTAHQVMAVLSEIHDVVPIYITREGRWLTSEALDDLDVYKHGRYKEVGESAFIPPSPGFGGVFVPGRGRFGRARTIPLDVVIPAIHGTYGEDGTVQGLLELADIPYVGCNVTASAVGMDKVAMKAVFAAAGLPVVRHRVVETTSLDRDREAVLDEVERAIGYPAFVKPSRLGSSVGIGGAADRSQLGEALEVAGSYDTRILIETAMEDCIEVNCSVLGGPGFEPRASLCEQPVKLEEFLSFNDKYLRGRKGEASEGAAGTKSAGMAAADRHIPAPISEALTKEVQNNALRAFKSIDAAGVARIDSFLRPDTGETWVMEINTVPGSFSFYLWEPSGVTFHDLVGHLLDIALASHRQKSELMFTFDSNMLAGLGGEKTGG